MGYGFLDGGKFRLLVGITYQDVLSGTAEQPSLEQWKRTFEVVSELLHHGTQGKFQIGEVYWVRISVDEVGWPLTPEATDAVLWHAAWGDRSLADPDGLGWGFRDMDIASEETQFPVVIVHELGHYAFNLEEEYSELGVPLCTTKTFMADPDGPVINTDPSSPSYMQVSVPPGHLPKAELHFCNQNNHVTTDGSRQQEVHGKSCLEVIDDRFDLAGAPTVPLVPPTWHPVQPEPRFALVLDASSNVGNDTLASMKAAALQFVALPTTQSSHQVAIVAYGPTTPSIVVPLQTLDQGTNAAVLTNQVNAMTLGGTADLASGLDAAVDEILGLNPRRQSAAQAVVAVANEPLPSGSGIGQVANRMKLGGVRGIMLANGDNAPVNHLKAVAWQTYGSFTFVADEPDLVEADWPDGIEEQLTGVVGALHGGELIGGGPTELQSPTQSELDAAADLVADLEADAQRLNAEPDEDESPTKFYVPAWVEHGSRRVIFTMNHSLGAAFRFYVQRPDGTVVNPTTDKHANRIAPRRSRFVVIEVDEPMAGRWVLRAIRHQGTPPVRVQVLAFSDNPRLRAFTPPQRGHHPPGKPFRLSVQVDYEGPIVGYDPPKYRIRKVGGRFRLQGELELDPNARIQGTYSDEVLLRESGSYDVEIIVRNTFEASRVRQRLRRPRRSSSVPPFTRTLRFQVQVGTDP